MLTVNDLIVFYGKQYIELRIDFIPDPGGKHLDDSRVTLNNQQIQSVLTGGELKFEQNGRVLVFDINRQGQLAISVVRGNIKEYPWRKIKRQMRETGFCYRSESPWFIVYEKGQWSGALG